MSYRIVVNPDVAESLRTLPGHVVRTAGHLLAEIADMAEALPARIAQLSLDAPLRLELGLCALLYEIDGRSRSVSVLRVEALEAREELAAPA